MKIRIYITFKQLTEVIKILQQNCVTTIDYGLSTSEDKIRLKANEILFKTMYTKLLKKQIDKHEHRKEFILSFSYPEAASLWQKLNHALIDDDYRQAVCYNISAMLHQKLISK